MVYGIGSGNLPLHLPLHLPLRRALGLERHCGRRTATRLGQIERAGAGCTLPCCGHRVRRGLRRIIGIAFALSCAAFGRSGLVGLAFLKAEFNILLEFGELIRQTLVFKLQLFELPRQLPHLAFHPSDPQQRLGRILCVRAPAHRTGQHHAQHQQGRETGKTGNDAHGDGLWLRTTDLAPFDARSVSSQTLQYGKNKRQHLSGS